jgi:serine/threonine protein kinase
MSMSDAHWNERGLSEHPHEREALEFLRQGLPDHDPWHAWARLQFRALDGSENEVDLLVFGPAGFFLVEIKAWEGAIDGDQGTITLNSGGRARQVDHPLRLLDLKCKRLKSLLESQPEARQSKYALPFLEGLLFLSHANEIRLEGPGASGVCLRDPKCPGILEVLRNRSGAGLRPLPRGDYNRPVAKLLAKALEQAGVSPRSTAREIEGFLLGDTLEETTYYRDRVGRTKSGPRVERRIRIYSVPVGSQLSREQVNEAADREAVVLSALDHPGILRLLHWTRTDLGPALFFEHLPKAQRLDHFLRERGERLHPYHRIGILNQVAEAVRYAHSKGIVHRALAPQNVLVVDPDEDKLRVQVTNWQTGARAPRDAGTLHSTFASLHSTSNPGAYLEQTAAVYAAPELRDDPSQRLPTVDVFSLGALCFRIFSGHAPAGSQGELFQLLQQHRGLSLAAVQNGTLPSLERLVREATAVEPMRRMATVEDFQLGILEFEDELTRPDRPQIQSPEDAVQGMEFSGGVVLGRRLGMGSIAIAFDARRGDDALVLKWARKPEHNSRIEGEAAAVRKLECDYIVRVVDEVDELGCRGYLMRPPSKYTLRKYLADEGPLHLELLERFGTQLLEAVEHLQARGIAHRDIKPDNIGITDAGRKQSLAIALFDFSLTNTPVTDIQAGTPRYLDPFLGERRRKQWDLAAERYAAAVTLHEMATGTLPRWGDGMTAAALTEGEVHVDSDLFPSEARSGLTKFFQKALARQPRDRFNDATEMREAWTRAVTGSLETRHVEAHREGTISAAEILAIVESAGVNTSLTSLPLSTRAANCLGRLGIDSVKALLETPPRILFMTRGVGQKTRVELDQLQETLRARFPEVEIRTGRPAPAVAADASLERDLAEAPTSIELLVERAFRTVGRLVQRQGEALDRFLGLAEGQDTSLDPWPTQSAVATQADIAQPNLSLLLKRCREKWSTDVELNAVRNHVALVLDAAGGVLTLPEGAAALLAHRSSDEIEPKRSAVARALLRILTESESGQEEPRWQTSRRAGQILLAASPAHASYALDLGAAADRVVQGPEVLGSAHVEQALAEVARPGSVAPLPPGRAPRLAAACSARADLSSRGELYAKGLAAERALRLSIDSVAALAERPKSGIPSTQRILTEERLREHIKGRYPRSAELPTRPALDKLLEEVGLEANWDPTQDAYSLREPEALSVVSPSTLRTRIPPRPAASGVRPREAVRFEEDLVHTLNQRGLRVLMVDPRDLVEARDQLIESFRDLRAISLDSELIQAMRAHAERKQVQWPVVLAADSRGSTERGGWYKLQTLVEAALGAVRAELMASTAPLLITDLGLLARYGRLSLIEDLRAAAGTAHPGTVILIPTDQQSSQPMLDGMVVPALPGQFERIPRAWLRPVTTR